MSAERQLNPSELNEDQLRTMALALIPHLNRLGIEERPMRQEEIAKMLGHSEQYVIKLRNQGKIKAHRIEGESTWYYYPSEINRAIRKKQ